MIFCSIMDIPITNNEHFKDVHEREMEVLKMSLPDVLKTSVRRVHYLESERKTVSF